MSVLHFPDDFVARVLHRLRAEHIRAQRVTAYAGSFFNGNAVVRSNRPALGDPLRYERGVHAQSRGQFGLGAYGVNSGLDGEHARTVAMLSVPVNSLATRRS